MQVSPQTTQSGSQAIDREIYQATLLKKAVKAEGDQQLKLIESTEQDSDGDEGGSRVGVYLNARA